MVTIGQLNANASASPLVKADIGANAIVQAGSTVTVTALSGKTPEAISDGRFDGAAAVDPAGDTVTLALKHGLLTGDTITYQADGNTLVGGMTSGRQYSVIATNDKTLQFGVTFGSGADVNLARDEVRFAAPHNLLDGDLVIYRTDSGAAVVGGLVSGATYRVRKIDSTTIKLVDPAHPSGGAKSFTGSNIASNTITLAAHGFIDGQTVTYHAPPKSDFTVANVDGANDTIRLGAGHGFQAGDELIYTAPSSSAAIGGLVTNQRYFVIYDASAPDVIKLAATRADALGAPGNPSATPPVPSVPPKAIDLTPSTAAADKLLRHSLRKVANLPIGGLVDGVTYYVTITSTNSFQLASDAARTTVVALVPNDPVSGAVLTGSSTLGTEGIDFQVAGTGRHRLIIDITADGAGMQRLEGVGGGRALSTAPSGDGIVTSSASGSSGGLVTVTGATTTASVRPDVRATLGDRATIQAFDVVVDATALGSAAATSANSGGGLVAVGSANATTNSDLRSTVTLGAAASISADHDVQLKSHASPNAIVLSDTNGGGLVDIAHSSSTANVNYASLLAIGSSTKVSARNQLKLDSQVDIKVDATATTDAAGLGAGATSNAAVKLGGASDGARTVIGANADLQAKSVDIWARVGMVDVRAKATGEADALGADAAANAPISFIDQATVQLGSDSLVTADQVTITAAHQNVNLSSTADADCDCGAGSADATAKVDDDTQSLVDAAMGATVAAHTLVVRADQEIAKYERTANADVAFIGGADATESGVLNAAREINWRGNVSLFSGPNPDLLVDANGAVVKADNVSVVVGPTSVSVAPIINDDDAGSVRFLVNTVNKLDDVKDAPPKGVISGSGGLFNAGATFEAISLRNQSNKTFVINGIQIANPDARPNVELNAEEVTLNFKVGGDAAARTKIEILNEGQSSVQIAALIDNPIGTTSITNTGGGILTTGGGVIRTNRLSLDARDAIGGTPAAPAFIELVRSGNFPTDLSAKAGLDISLAIAGRLREPNAANAIFDSASIIAGTSFGGAAVDGNIDLVLSPARQETRPIGTVGGIHVDVPQKPTLTGDYVEKFQSDAATPRHADRDFRVFPDLSSSTTIAAYYDFARVVGANIRFISSVASPADPRVGFEADTNVASNKRIDAFANGNVTIRETQGDLRFGDILSTAGNVTLYACNTPTPVGVSETTPCGTQIGLPGAVGATILSLAPASDSAAHVVGNSIKLVTTAGLGSLNDSFEINSSNQAPGVVYTAARQSIYMTETAGAMAIDGVSSDLGHVLLQTVSGSILDGNAATDAAGDGAKADIQGTDIDLIVRGGGVGSATNPVELFGAGIGQIANALWITSGLPSTGRLYATADQGIFLKESNAALNVLKVEAATGDVYLGIYDTVLGDVAFPGPFAEDFRLLDTPGASQLGVAVASGRVTATTGSVTIDAGDDLYLPLGTLVRAATTAWVQGDYSGAIIPANEVDPGIGSTIEIRGDVQAPQLEVRGGGDLDYIQLLGTGGINAAGITRLSGNGADDRFFLQAAVNNLTVFGGEGADRYYLTTTASKSAFMPKGYYDDSLFDSDATFNPYSQLGGTLATFAATVTINTGPIGPGGTRDVIVASTAGNPSPMSGTLTFDANTQRQTLTGLGMTGRIDVIVPDIASASQADGNSAFIEIELGSNADSLRVKSLGRKVVAEIHGLGGDDVVDVRNDVNSLSDIAGVVAFHGDAGNDRLDIFGDATAGIDATTGLDPDQLTGIGLTGLGMGTNALFSTHERFGARYDTPQVGSPDAFAYPGAIYYATRNIVNASDSYSSSVETVNLQLGGGDDTLTVDGSSPYSTVNVWGGAGNDAFLVRSTATGLHPDSTGRLDYLFGAINLNGQGGANSIVADDSGDDVRNTGMYRGSTLSGLGMPASGALRLSQFASIDILLGANADTFYVPTTDAAQEVSLHTGGGFDRIYLGSEMGAADSDVNGTLDGLQGRLNLFGDGPESGDELFFNDQATATGQTYLVRNAITGVRPIAAGGEWPVDMTTVTRTGAAEVRYQMMETVVLGGGSGADTIQLQGTHREQSPTQGKASTFTINGGGGDDVVNVGAPVAGGGFSLANFAIDLAAPTVDSVKGIPVLVNGQGGNDTLHFLDTASTAPTDLALASLTFANLFPSDPPTLPPKADDASVALFRRLFQDDPQSSNYASIVLAESGAKTPLNISARTSETVLVSLGSGDDVTQVTNGRYNFNASIYGGAGNDTFNVEHGVDMVGKRLVFNGEDGDDQLYVDFEKGVPTGKVNATFNGGSHVDGDRVRLAGDGKAQGGEYRPDGASAGGGSIRVAENELSFTGVEPLIVHGLPDFKVVAPDKAADLTLDSMQVSDLNLPSLVLHVVTVDGVVSWTQAGKLRVQLDSEPTEVGRAMAISGDTLVVGAKLRDANYGAVYVYQWQTDHWVEQAKLTPKDRGAAGQGFGATVALDGDNLLVGAPEDFTLGIRAGAAYLFRRSGTTWTQEAKFRAADGGSNGLFGSSVALAGDVAVVGSPGVDGHTSAAYVFAKSSDAWTQSAKLGLAGEFQSEFGRAVGIAGGLIAIGAPRADIGGADVGAVAVFQQQSGVWTRTATLSPSNPDPSEHFGTRLAMQGSRIVVGAPDWDGLADNLGVRPADQGRAFVFDFNGSNWLRMARLTADGGLTLADAAPEGNKGDHFGASVALDGRYVVVGAPDVDGRANDIGAAYMFQELLDQGVGHGSSWLRSSGSSGSGRVQAKTPAGDDPDAPLADHFGTAVAIGGGRVAIGLPGYNETLGNQIVRADVGAFRTFSTDSIAPPPTGPNMRAETIVEDNRDYGRKTLYDAQNRMLFVTAVASRSVDVYVNEGLYWRPTQTLTGNPGFGWDLDVKGNRLVIGAPDSNEAYVFTLSGETWQSQPGSPVSGAAYGNGRFGSSVAIDGDRMVVGAEGVRMQYASSGQADPNYKLDLGTPGVVYSFNYSNGAWQRDRLLMPYEANMPQVTSQNDVLNFAEYDGRELAIGYHAITKGGLSREITLGPKTAAVLIDMNLEEPAQDNTDIDQTISAQYVSNDTNDNRTFTLNEQRNASDTIDAVIVGSLVPTSAYLLLGDPAADDSYSTGLTNRQEGRDWGYWVTQPYTQVIAVDCCSTSGEGDAWFTYSGYFDSAKAQVEPGQWIGYEGGQSDKGSNYADDFRKTFPLMRAFGDDSPETDDADKFIVLSATPVTGLRRNTFSALNGAKWGAELALDGNRVYVGAPGANLGGVYDLTGSNHPTWTATVLDATGAVKFAEAPLTPSRPVGGYGEFGRSLDLRATDVPLYGSPGAYYQPTLDLSHDQTFPSGAFTLASGAQITLTAREMGTSTGTRGNDVDVVMRHTTQFPSVAYDTQTKLMTVSVNLATSDSESVAALIRQQSGEFTAVASQAAPLSTGDAKTFNVKADTAVLPLSSGDKLLLSAVAGGRMTSALGYFVSITDSAGGAESAVLELNSTLAIRIDLAHRTTADLAALINRSLAAEFKAMAVGSAALSSADGTANSYPVDRGQFTLSSGDVIVVQFKNTSSSLPTGVFQLIDAAGGFESTNSIVNGLAITLDFATRGSSYVASQISEPNYSATATGDNPLSRGDAKTYVDVTSGGYDATYVTISVRYTPPVGATNTPHLLTIEDAAIPANSAQAALNADGDLELRLHGAVSYTAIIAAINGVSNFTASIWSGFPQGEYVESIEEPPGAFAIGGGEQAGIVHAFNSSAAPPTKIASYNLQANGRFGERGALDASGNRILVGAPGEFGTSGGAAIYDDRGRYVGISLRPYRLNTQTTMGDDPTANLGFGVGASVVTDGLYVVGTAPTDTNLKETLYNFRYRGPSWTPLAIDDTLTPAALPKSKVGSSLSIDGGTAVVGARDYDGRGAAFVFTNTPGTDDWQLASVLQVSGIAIGSHFGSSVSIDGDTIVVGAPDVSNGNGAAYVYQRLGADWPLVKTLDRGTLSGFGRAVDVDGATIVVGADNAASVFEFTSGQWTSAAQLSDTGDFGVSVAVDRDSIVVGAPQASSLAGAVSVFTRDATGGGWSRQGSPLTVLTGAAGDQLGRAVDISGDSILIGAPGVASAQGAAYVFTRAGAAWSQQEKLSVGSGLAGDLLGFAVALDGDRAIVGAYGRDRNTIPADDKEGAAYAFGRKNGRWSLETAVDEMFGSDAEAGDYFGYSVAFDGHTAMIGAPQLDGRPGALIDTDGAGYVFIRSVSPPVNVVVPERQDKLIEGALANILTGTFGGVATSALHFFDITDFTLATGSLADKLTIGEDGLTAFGLANFNVLTGGGDDSLTTLSAELTPPAVGNFLPTGDFGGAAGGSSLPAGAGYAKVVGDFRFDGGAGVNSLIASADSDWRLTSDKLVADADDSLRLAHVQRASLIGGASANLIAVTNWGGPVAIDGGTGSDQITIDMTVNGQSTVAGGGGLGDQLTVLGRDASDTSYLTASVLSLATGALQYSGLESLRLAGGNGADRFVVVDADIARVLIEGNNGSDVYEIYKGTHSSFIHVRDGGADAVDVDELKVPADITPLVNTPFQVGQLTVLYENNVEKTTSTTFNPIVDLAGTEGPDLFVLDGVVLTVNNVPVDVTGVIQLTLRGLGGDDRLVVAHESATLESLAFIGGDGSDSVTASDTANTWTVTGRNAGAVTGAAPFGFSETENLVGGTADDRFVFANDDARVDGSIVGGGSPIAGAGGTVVDTLDYSARSQSVNVDLAASAATAVGTTISDIDKIVGGGGGDSLRGRDVANLWRLTSTGSGSIDTGVQFEKFETLRGGDAADRFFVADGATVNAIVGGAGVDDLSLLASDSADRIEIAPDRVTRNQLVTAYDELERLWLDARGGADVIEIVGTSGVATLVELHVDAGASASGGADLVDISGRFAVTGDVDVKSDSIQFTGGQLSTTGSGASIMLSATGSITTSSTALDVVATNLVAHAESGVTLDTSIDGLAVTNSTSSDVTIREIAGLSNVDVDAGVGGFYLTVTSGAVLDNDTSLDVRATRFAVTTSGGGVGSSAAPLQTAVDAFEARVQGALWLSDIDDLQLGGVGADWSGVSTNADDIRIIAGADSNGGAIDVIENLIATGVGADIYLATSGATTAGQNIVVRSTAMLTASGGLIVLASADDVTVETGVRFTSAGTVTVRVDSADDDPGVGGRLRFAGDIDAAGAQFSGNANDADWFSIRPDQDALASERTAINVDAAGPTSAPGDVLVIDAAGLGTPTLTLTSARNSGQWQFGAAANVNYTDVEDVGIDAGCFNLLLNMTLAGFAGGSTNDSVSIGITTVGSPTPTASLQIGVNGTPLFAGGAPSVCQFIFVGPTDNDSLDYSTTSAPIAPSIAALGAADGVRGSVAIAYPASGGAASGTVSQTFDNVDRIVGSSATGASSATGDSLVQSLNLPTTWRLTGVGAGVLAVAGSLQDLDFVGFENLVGAASAPDRFLFENSASLAGRVDAREAAAGATSANGDLLDFTNYSTGANVDLAAGAANMLGGGIASDSVGSSIEQVIGSRFGDTLVGDSDLNQLVGLGGDDVLDGRQAVDQLDGGDGNDSFRIADNEAEFDSFSGGVGDDRMVNVGDGSTTLSKFNTSSNASDTSIEIYDGGGRALRGNGANSPLHFGFTQILNTPLVDGGAGDDDVTVSPSNNPSGPPVTYDGNAGSADRVRIVITPDQLRNFSLADIAAVQSYVQSPTGRTLTATATPATGNFSATNFEVASLVVNDGGSLVDVTACFSRVQSRDQLIVGTSANDSLVGTAAADLIFGQDGDDWIDGAGGSDCVFGGKGNDTEYGNSGDDQLDGGIGADLLYGDLDNDNLSGGDDADVLFGGAGADWLDGGPGVDQVSGDAGLDTLAVRGAEAISDTLRGGADTDKILNVGGAPVVIAQFSALTAAIEQWDNANQPILGTETNNILDFRLDPAATASVSATTMSLIGVTYINTLAGNDFIYGTNGNDDLRGGDGNDVINAYAGGDKLYGGADFDSLNGGAGSDYLHGELGADTLTGGLDVDYFVFAGDESSVDSITDFANNEFIDLTGYRANNLTYYNIVYSTTSQLLTLTGLSPQKRIRFVGSLPKGYIPNASRFIF